MHRFRVTKYDPSLRAETGAYTKNEWTSFSDVGRQFDGETLSEAEYLRVESAYVEAARAFLGEDGASEFRVVGLEIRGDRPNPPIEGSLVPVHQVESIARSVLRNEFWCKLEADGQFLHFGWDYYMYVGVVSPCERAIQQATDLGLFVEEYDSPYLSEEEA